MTNEVELAALAKPLRALVAELEAGRLTAGPLAVAYLAGALAAIDAAGIGGPVVLPDLSQ